MLLSSAASVATHGFPGAAYGGRAAGASSRWRRPPAPGRGHCWRAGAPRRAAPQLFDLVETAPVGVPRVVGLTVAELAELARETIQARATPAHGAVAKRHRHEGGPDNPIGARAMYLWSGNKDTLLAPHIPDGGEHGHGDEVKNQEDNHHVVGHRAPES